jgi:siroheme synthase-like protein
MRYLPIELDVRGRAALVIGDRGEAEAKVERLLAAGARVTWLGVGDDDARVARLRGALHPPASEHMGGAALATARRVPSEEDWAEAWVVFVDGDDELAAEVHARALAERRLVCALDRPEHSTFANPAVAHAHGVTIAAGSGGVSPGTVKEIRRGLEAALLGDGFARWMAELGALRAALPRGERSQRMRDAVHGFAVDVSVRFPQWFERGAAPPGGAPGATAGSTPHLAGESAEAIEARYVHTNLIAHDWRRLVDFYVRVFGCRPVGPERDLSGAWLVDGTGVRGAHIQGRHLRMPGLGDAGPTLEIFGYDEVLAQGPPAANRAGFTHLAFAVGDVPEALRAVVGAGGSAHGKVVSHEVPGVGMLTFTYAADPEGNLIELQHWAPQAPAR